MINKSIVGFLNKYCSFICPYLNEEELRCDKYKYQLNVDSFFTGRSIGETKLYLKTIKYYYKHIFFYNTI